MKDKKKIFLKNIKKKLKFSSMFWIFIIEFFYLAIRKFTIILFSIIKIQKKNYFYLFEGLFNNIFVKKFLHFIKNLTKSFKDTIFQHSSTLISN